MKTAFVVVAVTVPDGAPEPTAEAAAEDTAEALATFVWDRIEEPQLGFAFIVAKNPHEVPAAARAAQQSAEDALRQIIEDENPPIGEEQP